ncbi:MAG: hypothetical protein OHK0012_10720 [Synechococcales cyanobacterium]
MPSETTLNALAVELPMDELTGLMPSETLAQLVDAEHSQTLAEVEFHTQMAAAWAVCDQCDLQTDIWRGRILRLVRERETQKGDQQGAGFLKWLQEHEITKSQAYRWLELAQSADTLLQEGVLDPATLQQFSKRAFVETAQSPPAVQQMIAEAAHQGQAITRREVRQLHDEWTALTSEVIPDVIREKASNQSIPPRLIAPLAREMERLPLVHQEALQEELNAHADADSLKQMTASARQLNRFFLTAPQLTQTRGVDLEQALAEALRLGCLNVASDLVSQAANLEQTLTRLYLTWRRLGSLADQISDSSGASTPHLRHLLNVLEHLTHNQLEVPLDSPQQRIRLTISVDPT